MADNSETIFSHQISVAPMLDWTDRHCRYFYRLMSQRAVLYTEMVTTGALRFGKHDFLAYNEQEHPLVLQLGGSDAEAMAWSAEQAQERGYDEVNINVGCPSDRVKNGSFGACLLAQPETVAACLKAMSAVVDIPVTVKTRLGIDDLDNDEHLHHFIDRIASAGCQHVILHARKAWLQGLSPKQNRDIPPLQYERVYLAKQRFPELTISINGGIKSLAEARQHLAHVDGVMIGREFYQNPWLLAQVDAFIAGDDARQLDRESVARAMIPYIQRHIEQGGRAWHVVRHMLGLFQQQPGGRRWRQFLSQQGPHLNDAEALIEGALQYRLPEHLSATP